MSDGTGGVLAFMKWSAGDILTNTTEVNGP